MDCGRIWHSLVISLQLGLINWGWIDNFTHIFYRVNPSRVTFLQVKINTNLLTILDGEGAKEVSHLPGCISTLGIVVTKTKGHGWAATFPALSFLATLQTQQRFAAVLVQVWQGQVVLGSSAKCRIPQKFHLLWRILALLVNAPLNCAPIWTKGRVKSLSQILVIGRC